MMDFVYNYVPKANPSVAGVRRAASVAAEQLHGMREGGRSFSSQCNPCGGCPSRQAHTCKLSRALRAKKRSWPAPRCDLDPCCAVQGHLEPYLYHCVNIILFSPQHKYSVWYESWLKQLVWKFSLWHSIALAHTKTIRVSPGNAPFCALDTPSNFTLFIQIMFFHFSGLWWFCFLTWGLSLRAHTKE